MKTKRVLRYYCDYCKKVGGSSYWMQKHENRCTLNPNRICGYCNLLDQPQPDLALLVALLPNPDEHLDWDEYSGSEYFSVTLDTAIKEALPKLREASENCPACIMAALRQRGIPVPMAQDFNFTKESQEIWDEFNAAKRADDERFIYD